MKYSVSLKSNRDFRRLYSRGKQAVAPTMVLYTLLGRDLDPTSGPVLICLGIDLACIAASWIVLKSRKNRKGKQNDEKAL